MKKLYLLFTCLWFAVSMNMEAQIHIGESYTPLDQYLLPIRASYHYSYSQQIVLAAEYQEAEGVSGPITQIKWKLVQGAVDASKFNDWTVYLGHTTKTSFSSDDDFIPSDSLQQVFSGIVTIIEDGEWITIDLPTPFIYDATKHLVVAVQDNKPGSVGGGYILKGIRL